jgi:hypothetical protein
MTSLLISPWLQSSTISRRCLQQLGADGRSAPDLGDEVGLIDHTCGLAAGDADEDALVEPVELGSGGLDSGCGAEGVLAGVDLLTTPEPSQDLGAAMSDAPRLDVEQLAPVGTWWSGRLAWLVGYRRLQVRYERRADILLGFLHLACALICLNSLNRTHRPARCRSVP